MLAHSDLQRSIRAMTIGLMRSSAKRAQEGDLYRLANREQHFQMEFTGQVGLFPVEKKVDLGFDVLFIADTGNQLDSNLDRPQVRIGFEEDYAPPGTIPYGKIVAWKRDVDYNFVGAKLLVGVHCPSVAIEGLLVSQARFKFAAHISFQGLGSVFDVDSGSFGVVPGE